VRKKRNQFKIESQKVVLRISIQKDENLENLCSKAEILENEEQERDIYEE